MSNALVKLIRVTLIESLLHVGESTLLVFSRSDNLMKYMTHHANSISVIVSLFTYLFTDFDWWIYYCLCQVFVLITIFIRLQAVVFIPILFFILKFQKTAYLIIPCTTSLLTLSNHVGNNSNDNILVISIIFMIISNLDLVFWWKNIMLTFACESVITYNYQLIGWKHINYLFESDAPFIVNVYTFLLGIRANSVERWSDLIDTYPTKSELPSCLQGVWWNKGVGFTLLESMPLNDNTFTVPLSTSGTRAFPPTWMGFIRCYVSSLHPSITLTYSLDKDHSQLKYVRFLTLPLPTKWFIHAPVLLFNESVRDNNSNHRYLFVSSNILRRRIMRYLLY